MIISAKRIPSALLWFVLAASFWVPTSVHAQGCSQCREAVGQTPALTQQAFRRGIGVMIFAAGSVFVGSALMLRRFR